MTEQTGYTEREYRIYGHKCTQRRYKIEWFGAVLISAAIALAVFIEGELDPETWLVALMASGAFLASMYYRIRTMNVNGYDDEKPEESLNAQLFPWRTK